MALSCVKLPDDMHRTDIRFLFIARFVRMFAYGFVSVLLVLYLSRVGLSNTQIGLLLSLTLVGDIGISLLLTTTADRLGRRRTLVIGAVLMVLAGIVFGSTSNYLLLLLAATVGVISPSGNEVGPFLSVEQASLTQVIADHRRTAVFSWYNLAGSVATALGAIVSGGLTQMVQNSGMPATESYRLVIWIYGALGAVLAWLSTRLSGAVEAVRKPMNATSTDGVRVFWGLHRSKHVVARLSALFSLDSFAGGFVMQSIVAYWFHTRWGLQPATLGAIFFGANILAAVSSLAAARIAAKIGLVKTMVFTHLPSNVLLILVPLMPNVSLAILVLLLRFSISQMDVPTRQSYVMAIVEPDERSAAAGVTSVARSVGASISPSLATMLMASPALLAAPFLISGILKICYDLLLYRGFVATQSRQSRTETELR
jgi:MFS family permease